MRGAPPALLALLLLGTALAAGCFEPFRVHVDADVIPPDAGWVETRSSLQGGGLGPRTVETRYALDPADGGPPFPGTLQVFSIRAPTRVPADDLIRLAEQAVEDGAEDYNIAFEGDPVEGQRVLASGVRTHWFLRNGVTTEGGEFFDEQVRIRILGEAGHDGRSSTSFLAIALVQVERAVQCPLVAACQPERSEATWIQVVGDPDGSVAGASSQTGFIDHLVTR